MIGVAYISADIGPGLSTNELRFNFNNFSIDIIGSTIQFTRTDGLDIEFEFNLDTHSIGIVYEILIGAPPQISVMIAPLV